MANYAAGMVKRAKYVLIVEDEEATIQSVHAKRLTPPFKLCMIAFIGYNVHFKHFVYMP